MVRSGILANQAARSDSILFYSLPYYIEIYALLASNALEKHTVSNNTAEWSNLLV